MALPFEEIKRKILVKKETAAEEAGERIVEELIKYGVVNIDKPKGPTSHQVSAFVQKILGVNKSGHSGTLDPNVSGVLPTALEKATRIVEVLLKAGKEYVGVMHLHKEVSEEELMNEVEKFRGKIRQKPPIKSAVKRVERTREVYYFDILEIDGKDVLFKVGCQAGTYIRKLCLHPETEIISNDSLILAKDFFVNPKFVYSRNNKKIEQKLPSETQKFSFRGKLVKITMASGIEFTVTPDHRMLVSSDEGYIMKQASNLKNSDYIVKSLKYPAPELNPAIADLLDEGYLIDQEEIRDLVKDVFIQEYGSIRGMYRKLKLDRKAFLNKSRISIPISHTKKAGFYDKIKGMLYKFKTEKGTHVKLFKLNSSLMYLIGLIASDGNNTKEKGTKRHTRIKFHNKNEYLIDLFLIKYRKIFPDFNISKTKRKDGIIQLDTSNSFLAAICAKLGVKSPQKDSDLLPILCLNKKLLASFLRGYFDGDGTAYYKKKSRIKGIYSRIDFFTVSKTAAKRIHQMLLKLDITNTIFKRKTMFVISINDLASKKRFISLIGSNHPFKREKLRLIKRINSSEIKDNMYIGFHYKKNIKEYKSKLHKMGGNLHRVLNSSIPITKGFYKKANRLINLPPLDEFCIEKIKYIELIPYKGKVYDMTVPETHNFLIETGYVSSNCHDLGRGLGGAHMSELRRTKAGPFDESTLVTLQDLADAYWYLKNEGNEKFIRFCVKPIEFAVQHLPKVWVLDNAVKSLCHGRDLAVPGINKLNDLIKAGDAVAIMNSCNRLIAIGEAAISSEEMVNKEKGIAVDVKKVFMESER